MIPILLWVCGCYALAAIAVHAAFRYTWKQERKIQHYVLLAGNEQLHMEWYMRSLRRYAIQTGKEVQVTVVNRGSDDETMDIARLFVRRGMNVNIASGLPFGSSGRIGYGTHEFGFHSGSFGTSDDESWNGPGDEEGWIYRQRLMADRKQGGEIDEGDGEHDIRVDARIQQKRPSKWQRLRRRFKASGLTGQNGAEVHGDALEPTHLMWMLQAEGIITEAAHAVLIDLRNPSDLSKLPL
ncbi:glycosyltransferase family A protein [Paenibacillus mendelii]|uniref:Glycosyltransferase family A protein n=1 Tax=Paenibacillus mendelii TaxID=206163 RepID=A0ABV6J3G4_9BACL|nr:glycosyltransferase family A protein [Paenibacillus mendelii]MCQ6561877.1 glycosyltransferase family 2 protein [Paenibacillus mendelii]